MCVESAVEQTAEPLLSSLFPSTGPDSPPQAAEGKAGILGMDSFFPGHSFSNLLTTLLLPRPSLPADHCLVSGPTALLSSVSKCNRLASLGNRHWDGDLHAITGKCAWEWYCQGGGEGSHVRMHHQHRDLNTPPPRGSSGG